MFSLLLILFFIFFFQGATLALVASKLSTNHLFTLTLNQTGGPPAKRHCLNGANSPTTNSSTPHYHDQDYNNSQWYPFSKPKPTLPTNETIQIVAECREFWSCQNNQQRNDLLPSCKHSTQSVVKPIQSTQKSVPTSVPTSVDTAVKATKKATHEIAMTPPDWEIGKKWFGVYEKCIVLNETDTTYDVEILSDGAVCQDILKLYVRRTGGVSPVSPLLAENTLIATTELKEIVQLSQNIVTSNSPRNDGDGTRTPETDGEDNSEKMNRLNALAIKKAMESGQRRSPRKRGGVDRFVAIPKVIIACTNNSAPPTY